MKKKALKYLRIYPLFIFIFACSVGGLNDKTKELSGGYIARLDGSISYILPDNIFVEGIYPNVIDFAFDENFILVCQMPLKEKFVTFLAQDMRTRYNLLANGQDTSMLTKYDYDLIYTNQIADSSFYRILSKELSPNNSEADIRRSEEIAKDLLIKSDYYRSILQMDTCFWIISHVEKHKYGPFTQKEFFSKANELNVPNILQLEFGRYIE